MEYEYHYSRYAALKSYIDRIGAEQLNFRRFMVKEYHGSHYYVEKVLIKITADFEIECGSPEYAPTEEERTAIRDELSKVEFPHSVRAGLPQVDELLQSGLVTGQLFTFLDSARREVIMCQERRETDKGKAYIPWTLYHARGGKGTWRQMEPDGPLPFWKPQKRRGKASIMVHEGAKTAWFVDSLVNDPERRADFRAHPWGEELARFEHWGAIGGALAIHRCDYDELRREKIEGDLYYACDRDFAGQEAVRTFSRLWGGALYALKFDDSFREGWDLADRLPECLYSKSGTVAKRLMAYADPATWATVKNEKKKGEAGRPGYRLTKSFQQEWVHTVNPEIFCHTRMSHKKYDKARDFDSAVRPFSDVDDTSRFLKASYASKAVGIKYNPGRKPGLFEDDGNVFMNVYVPSSVIPYPAAVATRLEREGAFRPWTDFLTHLFTDEHERAEVMRWAATLLARPSVKMNYGLLLVSEMQGVGKTTFADFIAGCLGESNVSYPNESLIIGNFNNWAGERRLAVVSEIYQGHSMKAYNLLKEIMTDKTISVNKKFVASYTTDNYVHLIACSNSTRALKLDNTDRRWLIPAVVQVKQPHAWWQDLYGWYDECDGRRKLLLWAECYVRDHGYVLPGAEAPWTRMKAEMIEENDSPGMEYFRGLARWLFELSSKDFRTDDVSGRRPDTDEINRLCKAAKDSVPVVFFDHDGVRAIINEVYGGRKPEHAERPLDIRKIAVQEGLFAGKERITKPAPGFKRYLTSRVISSSLDVARMDPNEVTCHGLDSREVCILDLTKLASQLGSI